MHLSMSCPNGGSAGIYGLLTRKRCPCQGKYDCFWPGHPRGSGLLTTLTELDWACYYPSCAPKRERKTNIEPRIKLNHNIYKLMKHITVLCLLKLKMIFKWNYIYLNLYFYSYVYSYLYFYLNFLFLFIIIQSDLPVLTSTKRPLSKVPIFLSVNCCISYLYSTATSIKRPRSHFSVASVLVSWFFLPPLSGQQIVFPNIDGLFWINRAWNILSYFFLHTYCWCNRA